MDKSENHVDASSRIMSALDKATRYIQAIEAERVEPVAILGMGCRFPGKVTTPDEFWEMLKAGQHGFSKVPMDRWDNTRFYSPDQGEFGKTFMSAGGFIEGVSHFDPEFFGISLREAKSMDPQQRILLEVTWEALERSGISPDSLRGSKCGVFIGLTYQDYSTIQFRSNPLEEIDIHSGTGVSFSMASGRISHLLGVHGPSMTVDTSCSSSLMCVHLAMQSLRSREINLAIVGGCQLMLAPDSSIYLSKLGALGRHAMGRAFDARAEGMVRGEGCGVVVLERVTDARKENHPILSLIRGSATCHDGASSGLTIPNPAAQTSAILEAHANGGTSLKNVLYIEAHGTGTPLGDPIEIGSLKQALEASGQRDNLLYIGSVKNNIGHLESASGIAGLVKATLILNNRYIVPHIHCEELNPNLDLEKSPIRIAREPVVWPDDGGRSLLGVSSFGFSGANVHVVLGLHEPAPLPAPSDAPPPPLLLPISSKRPEDLPLLVQRYLGHLKANPRQDVRDFCYSAGVGRNHWKSRLAFVATGRDQLVEALEQYVSVRDMPETGESESDLKSGFQEKQEWKHSGDSLETPAVDTGSKEALEIWKSQYLSGWRVDWREIYGVNHGRKRIAIPTYPFKRVECWLPFHQSPFYKDAPLRHAAHLYTLKWIESPQVGNASVSAREKESCWILLDWPGDFDSKLNRLLMLRGARVYRLRLSERYEASGTEIHVRHESGDFYRVFQHITSTLDHDVPIEIVHAWSLSDTPDPKTVDNLKDFQKEGSGSLLLLYQDLIKVSKNNHRLWCVTDRAINQASGLEIPSVPGHASLSGMARTIMLERPDLWGGIIHGDRFDRKNLPEILIQEIAGKKPEEQVLHSKGRRFVPRLERISEQRESVSLESTKAILITGGTGALGLKLTEWLCRRGARKILLISRTAPSSEASKEISRLNEHGVKVSHLQGDVASEEDLDRILQVVHEEGLELEGIFHVAGVSGFEDSNKVGMCEYWNVMRPKLQAAWLLHSKTIECKLRYFVMFSSIASLWGAQNQIHYAAANAFLDELCSYRRALGLPGLSINWGPWSGGGMTSPHGLQMLARLGIRGLSPSDALDRMGEAMAGDQAQVTIADIDWPAFAPIFGARKKRYLFERVLDPDALFRKTTSPSNGTPASGGLLSRQGIVNEKERAKALQQLVHDEVHKVLGVPKNQDLPMEKGFFEMGMDSMIALELCDNLEKKTGCSLPLTTVFKYPTIREVTEFLLGKLSLPASVEPESLRERPSTGSTQEEDGQVRDTLESEILELKKLIQF